MPEWTTKIIHWVRRQEVQLTLLYCLGFFGLGLVLAGFGPSIPDLRANTDTTAAEQARVISVRAAGYLAGSGMLLSAWLTRGGWFYFSCASPECGGIIRLFRGSNWRTPVRPTPRKFANSGLSCGMRRWNGGRPLCSKCMGRSCLHHPSRYCDGLFRYRR